MTTRSIKTKLADAEATIRKFLNERFTIPPLPEDAFFIAGGAIASLLMDEEPNDFDIYFTYQTLSNRCKTTFITLDDKVVFISDQAITIKLGDHNFQLIIGWYGDANNVTSKFDFVHTMGWYKNGNLKIWNETLISILTKELFYTGSEFPLASFIRVRKFLSRGWTINAGQLLKIAFDIHKLDLMDPDVLRSQLQGIDLILFNDLLEEWDVAREQIGAAMGDGMAPHTDVDIIKGLIDNNFGIDPTIE